MHSRSVERGLHNDDYNDDVWCVYAVCVSTAAPQLYTDISSASQLVMNSQ